MSFSGYHYDADPIWQDGTFKRVKVDLIAS